MQYARDLRSTSAVDLTSVLEGTSRELRSLASMAIQIQCIVSELALQVAPTDTSSLRGLQQLDHVTQSIAGIATYLEALAEAAPSGCWLDAASAAQRVDVADLAARLSLAFPAKPTQQHSNGDCQLFQD